MTRASVHRWTASDGVELAWHEMGEGRPAVLVHGLLSDAHMNWIKFGHAARIAADGFRVIMPDLRAHGLSAAPHEADKYPPGILGRDLVEFIGHLGLEDYDLGGFSLGSRTTIDGVASGLKPRKAFLGGVGLKGLKNWEKRKLFFLEAIDLFETAQRDDPHMFAIHFMRSQGVDREAIRLLLHSFADTDLDTLDVFTMPTLVVCGDEDRDNGSPQELADRLPNGIFVEVPGTHMSSVTKPELGEAIAAFLANGAL